MAEKDFTKFQVSGYVRQVIHAALGRLCAHFAQNIPNSHRSGYFQPLPPILGTHWSPLPKRVQTTLGTTLGPWKHHSFSPMLGRKIDGPGEKNEVHMEKTTGKKNAENLWKIAEKCGKLRTAISPGVIIAGGNDCRRKDCTVIAIPDGISAESKN